MTPVGVPVLETPRLRMRGHRAEDLDDCAALWGDPQVVRFILPAPATREDAWRRMLVYAGLWALAGRPFWLVEERETGRFVGEVGFMDFRRETEPAFHDAAELGWVLATWAHGRGYASEAVAAALEWGEAHLAAPRAVAMIDPGHAASVRVAERHGFRRYAGARYRCDPVALFERSLAGRARE